MSDRESDTYRSRLRKYERREQMAIWIAAGAAALVAFAAAGALQDAPMFLKKLVYTATIVAGGAIAFARVGFEWHATLIKRDIDDEKVKKSDALEESREPWPSGPERWWTLALVTLMVGWGIMFVGIWWPQILWIVCRLRRG